MKNKELCQNSINRQSSFDFIHIKRHWNDLDSSPSALRVGGVRRSREAVIHSISFVLNFVPYSL